MIRWRWGCWLDIGKGKRNRVDPYFLIPSHIYSALKDKTELTRDERNNAKTNQDQQATAQRA